MRTLHLICLLLISIAVSASDEEDCSNYVRIDENYKTAHEYQSCLDAAKSGSAGAMYFVGMGYGFSKQSDKELLYYRLAAEKGFVSAYLALGHVLRAEHEDEAIKWYEMFARSKAQSSFYAAGILMDIYKSKGDVEKASYWEEFMLSISPNTIQ